MRDVTEYAENVGFETLEPTSHAIEVVVEQWLNNAEEKNKILGDFNLSTIAISK